MPKLFITCPIGHKINVPAILHFEITFFTKGGDEIEKGYGPVNRISLPFIWHTVLKLSVIGIFCQGSYGCYAIFAVATGSNFELMQVEERLSTDRFPGKRNLPGADQECRYNAKGTNDN